MSSSRPHLHAPHCTISSVVPVNAPSTREPSWLMNPALDPLTCTPVIPTVWLAASLSGRHSAAARTRDAQSLGSAEPGGRVAKYPPPGDAAAVTADTALE